MKTLVVTVLVPDDCNPDDAHCARLAAEYAVKGSYKDRTGEILVIPGSSWAFAEKQA